MNDNFSHRKICAIVVTYNRNSLLVRCIDAVINQTYKCHTLLIVDNASTDGTDSILKDRFRSNCDIVLDKVVMLAIHDNISIQYVKKSTNSGGAGGFSTGMEVAHGMGIFDGYWIMDDDGYPSAECLERQIKYLSTYGYVMPASIDVDNHLFMSWPTVLKGGGKSMEYSVVRSSWGEIMQYVYPFNGSLLSSCLVSDVGYVDKRLFIWGDEYDHYWRCRSLGYMPVTIIDAEFYHPANKMAFTPIFFKMIKVPYVESKWKMVCLARNYTYIYRHYGMWYKIPIKFLIYTWLFIVTRKFDWQGWWLYVQSVKDGFVEDFSRHYKYLK